MKKDIITLNYMQDKSYQQLFEEYIKYCKIKKLADETIRTYFYHHKYFMQFIQNDNILCSEITQELIDNYRLSIIERDLSSVTVNTYINNIAPVIKYGIKLGYVADIEFIQVKEEEKIKPIYTKEELRILLKKPNMKKSSFAEYRNWVIINFLLGTGVRAKELRNVRVKDVNLDSSLITLQTTKNKKARYIPISATLNKVLSEYLEQRQHKSDEDFLFSNQYGEQMPRTTLQMAITKYSKKRGVFSYSLHQYRHTFATMYLRNGGDPFTLQRILGHSSLKMVNNYLQLDTTDLQKRVDTINPLEQVVQNTIKMK